MNTTEHTHAWGVRRGRVATLVSPGETQEVEYKESVEVQYGDQRETMLFDYDEVENSPDAVQNRIDAAMVTVKQRHDRISKLEGDVQEMIEGLRRKHTAAELGPLAREGGIIRVNPNVNPGEFFVGGQGPYRWGNDNTSYVTNVKPERARNKLMGSIFGN